jgi:hypothetical protein
VQAGSTVMASPGVWSGTAPLTFSYQWELEGAPIAGATAATLPLGTWYAGTLEVAVTAANDAGSSTAYSQSVTIPYPPGAPMSIVASVSGASTVTVLGEAAFMNQNQACVNVHLADGATGDPVQASNVSLGVQYPTPLGPMMGTGVSGSTDATGNGTFCYTGYAFSPLSWTVTDVFAANSLAYSAGANGGFQESLPLTSNTFTQQFVIVGCPPACSTTSTTAGGTSTMPTESSTSPGGDTPTTPVGTTTTPGTSTTSAGAPTAPGKTSTAGPAPTTTGGTSQEGSATKSSTAAGSGIRSTTLTVMSLAPVLLTHPSISLVIKASKPAVISLTLRDSKGLITDWTRRAKTGVNKVSLPIPPKARHPGRDTLHISSVGAKTATLPITLTA